MRTGASLVVLVVALTACTSQRAAPDSTAASSPSSSHSKATATGSACPIDHPSLTTQTRDRVLVFFACKDVLDPDDVLAFARPVDPQADTQARLLAAVTAYLEGPQGREANFYISLGTPEVLNSVAVEGSRAIIDLDLAAAGLTSTTSTQSALMWAHLSALAFQFPGIKTMEPRFNGSCHAFGHAVEAGECLITTRDGRSIRG